MVKINIKDWKRIPNLVSLFRIIFVPMIFIFFKELNNQNRWAIIFCLILFSLLDNLDGFLARKLNQISEFGKLIDPLVDKIFIISLAINLYHYNLLPAWFIFIVIIRDILIMFAGLIFIKHYNNVPSSDIIGKMTVGAIGIISVLSLLNFQRLKLIFDLSIILCAFLIFLSLINYGYKQFKLIK